MQLTHTMSCAGSSQKLHKPPCLHPADRAATGQEDTACQVCRSTAAEPPMLLCDGLGCSHGYHISCLRPPIPASDLKNLGDWFCPECCRSAAKCVQCNLAIPEVGLPLACTSCTGHFHRACPGLHKTAFLAGEFVCAPCALLAAKVSTPTEQALEDAHHLVYLQANRVKCSSLDTYATSLARFTHYVTQVLRKPLPEALPPGPAGVILSEVVRLFLAYAARNTN